MGASMLSTRLYTCELALPASLTGMETVHSEISQPLKKVDKMGTAQELTWYSLNHGFVATHFEDGPLHVLSGFINGESQGVSPGEVKISTAAIGLYTKRAVELRDRNAGC